MGLWAGLRLGPERSAAVKKQSGINGLLPASGRAHGLLKKIPYTYRYQLTTKGRHIVTALLAACDADVQQLTQMAA